MNQTKITGGKGPSKEQTEKSVEILQNLLSGASFFATLLQENRCGDDTIDTHLSLIQHHFEDLAAVLDQPDYQDAQRNETLKLLRAANEKISLLESQSAESITAAQMVAKLQQFENWFGTWYGLTGFHFVQTKHHLTGFYADFSDEIEQPEETEEKRVSGIHFGSRDFALRIASVVPYAFNTGYNLHDEKFHYVMLDCDQNRENLKNLLESTFPGAEVSEFKSRFNRYGHKEDKISSLQMKAYIPYAAIETWHTNILNLMEHKGHNNQRLGKLYVRKAELESNLKSSAFTRYASQATQKEARSELDRIKIMTDQWDSLISIPTGTDTDTIETAWNRFPAGTPRETIYAWFEKQFDINVAEDLIGR